MSEETKLRECKTLAKLIAIGDSTAGADLCQRVDKAADLIASQSTQLSQALLERDEAILSRNKSNSTLGGLIGNVLDPLKSERDQALRELEAARSHSSALMRDVEHAEAQRDTALRELGEAREQIDSWRARCAELEALQP